MLGLMSLKASMTTFPFTDWIGSTTTATALNTTINFRTTILNQLNATQVHKDEVDNQLVFQPVWQSFKALLCVDIYSREPASEARVRVVPEDNHCKSAPENISSSETFSRKDSKLTIQPPSLACQSVSTCPTFLPVKDRCRSSIEKKRRKRWNYLENWINCFDGNPSSRLWHRKHINNSHCKDYSWRLCAVIGCQCVKACLEIKFKFKSPVYSSTNSPSIRPITSMGTPARPCFNIFSKARDEM